MSRMTVEDITRLTPFTRPEVDILNRNYSRVAGLNDKIDRSRFRDMLADVFRVDDSLIMDRGSHPLI